MRALGERVEGFLVAALAAALVPLALVADVRGLTIRIPWLVQRRVLFGILNHLSWRRLWNIGRVELDRVRQRLVVSGRPFLSIVDPVGTVCNLGCPLCPSGGKKDTLAGLHKGLMTMETFEQAVAALREYGCYMALYNWGESLLHPRIFEFARCASEADLGVAISSHLNVHLTDESAQAMVLSGLERLIVSIDGTTQETYELYRVGGSLAKLLENVERIVEAKRRLRRRYPVVEFQFVVMQHNEHQLEEIRLLARRYGVDCLTLIPCKLITDVPEAKRFVSTIPGFQFRLTRTERDVTFHTPERECAYLWRQVKVNWDGGILTCCNCVPGADDSYYFGEIEAKDLPVVWNNEHYQASRSVVAEGLTPGRAVRSPKCEKCLMVLPQEVEVPLPDGVRGGRGRDLRK